MPEEIIEEGITSIEMAASSTFNRTFTPHEQRAKWFRDELGQLWVKFQTERRPTLQVVDHVWPAGRVVEVQYEKKATTST